MDFNTGSGGRAGSSGSGSGPGGAPPGAAAASEGEFDYRDPVQSFINVVRNVVTDPVGFFRGIRPRGDFVNPLIFAVICYEVYAILSGIIAVASGAQGFGRFLVEIILAPIGAVIFLFIGAGIFHLLVMLIVGSPNAGFEGTFRVGAYLSVTQLVAWLTAIPILGFLVGILVFFYSIFLGVVGVREMHSTTMGKAALVVLIPVVVLGGLAVLIIGAALFAIFAGSR